MNDVMRHFSTGIHGGRVCQETSAGWVVSDARWLFSHGCLFRIH